MTILTVNVNTKNKAERIVKARKGFYEVFYELYAKRIYTVFYNPTQIE